MINEERVKELYHAAIYEAKQKKDYEQVRLYYRGDYIGKELLKSFFCGTILFGIFVLIWIIGNGQELLEQINHIDYLEIGSDMGVLYCVFMLVYFLVTWIVYAVRYVYAKREYQKYGETLKKINRMYVREDKLKV